MQPIHRTPCQEAGPPASLDLAGYLARLIDGRAQARTALSAGGQGPDSAGVPDGALGGANVLIWVEDDAAREQATPGDAASRGPKQGRGLPDPCSRRMIVAAHSPGQAAAECSFIISYPAGAGGGGQRIPGVSAMLTGMGWSVLAFRRWRTAAGRTSTAVLVNTVRPGEEQRLWLAEPPVPGLRRSAIPSRPGPGRPCHAPLRLRASSTARRAGASRFAQGMRKQLEARANEGRPAFGAGRGGAGNDVSA